MSANPQQIALLSMTLENKLNEQGRIYALKQCEEADEKTLLGISSIAFKNPLIGLLLQIFLGVFGVGRFYKGKGVDIALGIAFIIGACMVCAMLGYGLFSEDEVILIVSCVLVVIYTIAVYVDSYFVYRGIQSDNLLRLQEYLFFSKHNDK